MHIKWTENSVSRRDLNSPWVKRMVVVGCGGGQGGGEGRGDLADSSSSTQIVIGFEVSITSSASGGAERGWWREDLPVKIAPLQV